jgi:hypothetical protein
MQLPYLLSTLHTYLHKHLCLNGVVQIMQGYYFLECNFTCFAEVGKITAAYIDEMVSYVRRKCTPILFHVIYNHYYFEPSC